MTTNRPRTVRVRADQFLLGDELKVKVRADWTGNGTRYEWFPIETIAQSKTKTYGGATVRQVRITLGPGDDGDIIGAFSGLAPHSKHTVRRALEG
jgi:hypothetical protein